MTEVIARHAFSVEEQESFARMSGDHNPIHMDALAARRTQAGAPVVHGMHVLLWAMENLVRTGFDLTRLRGGKAKFTSFVLLGKPVNLKLVRKDDSGVRLEVGCDDESAMIARLDLVGEPARRSARPMAATTIPVEPYDPDFSCIEGKVGCLRARSEAKQQSEMMFPATSRALGSGAVCDFALMSTLVGMFVPGLHSILSEISFSVIDEAVAGQDLTFAVTRADQRFRLVEMKAEGARILGRVAAFARLPSPPAPTIRQALSLVVPGEFFGRRALVIGGSRGLGAATSVLLAAGGASITLSYRDGCEDAENLAHEIRGTCGKKSCSVMRYDACAGAGEQISVVDPGFTHAYYFATPRIFDGGSEVYARARFDKFLAVYVEGFLDFVKTLLRAQEPTPLAVLYPSSIAVVERPRRMTEYAMAKAAGEILCDELVRTFPRLTITAPRLPRIATAQTATVPPVPAGDPIAIMLPLLRKQTSAVTDRA
jgi:acyl dehydratase